jgi:hypothetical protein
MQFFNEFPNKFYAYGCYESGGGPSEKKEKTQMKILFA